MVCSLVSITFDSLELGDQLKPIKTLEYWSRVMLNFYFLEKGLRIVSLPHFVYDFSGKMFLVLYSINLSKFIVWLPLLLEILLNMCVGIVWHKVT